MRNSAVEAAILSTCASLADRVAVTLQNANVNCVHLDSFSGDHLRETAKLEPFDVVILATDHPCHHEFNRLGQLAVTTDKKIVLVGDVSETSSALEAVRRGAFDVLDHQTLNEVEIRKLVDRLYAVQATRSGRKSEAFAIASTGNCDDASLLAVNLAAYLSSKEHPANLMDLRVTGYDIAISLRLDVVHNTHDLLARNEIDPSMLQQAMIPHAAGIRVLTSVCSPNTAQDLTSGFVNRIVDCSKILGCPAVVCTDDVFHLTDPELFFAFDKIILPTRMDVVSIWRTQMQIEHLNAIGISSRSIVVIGVCDHNIPKPTSKDLQKIFSELSVAVVEYDAFLHATSTNLGQPTLTQYPHSKLSESLRAAFANYVVGDGFVKHVPDFWSRVKSNLANQLARFNGV